VDPYGRVVARAPEDDVALLLVDLDLSLVEEARRDMPFLRDRRPETYGLLVAP
jgi:N-carbamoylputrescine amidase